MKPIKLRIIGHELKPVGKKGETVTVLKVKLRGVEGNEATNATLVVDMSQQEEYPLGDGMVMRFEKTQLEMPMLDPASPPRANGRGRRAAAPAN